MTRKEVQLEVGELHIAEEPTLIKTILGSCIALALYSPEHHMGAMCHAMLPREGETHRSPGPDQRFKFVDASVSYMLEAFRRLDIPLEKLEVSLFGGADMMVDKKTPDKQKVGKRNIKEATRLIKKFNLNLIRRDTAGRYGRKVLFNSYSGEFTTRRLKKAANNRLYAPRSIRPG